MVYNGVPPCCPEWNRKAARFDYYPDSLSFKIRLIIFYNQLIVTPDAYFASQAIVPAYLYNVISIIQFPHSLTIIV